MTTLLIIALCVFSLYTIFVLAKFKIPVSYSDTYYLLERWKKGTGHLFTLFCLGIVFTIMPVWLDHTKEQFQFISFLAAGGLAFVGVACEFKEKLTDMVHYVSAGICVACSLLWQLLDGIWYIPVALYGLAAIMTARDVRRWGFWFELAAFVSLFVNLFITVCG